MKTIITKTIALLLASGLAMSAHNSAAATELWYEDNNMGKAGGIPADFFDKFDKPESFAKASQYIKVYMLSGIILKEKAMDNTFFKRKFIPYLKKNNIKLALNMGGATWTQLGNRINVAKYEVNQLQRLKRLGVEVSYIGLQSALGTLAHGTDADYPMEKRLQDIPAYAKLVHEIYPQAQIGIIVGLTSDPKEYREPFRKAQKAMDNIGIPLAYMHLDMPFHIPKTKMRGVTWQNIRDFETYLENELGINFGIITTSYFGGHHSDKEFHDDAIDSMRCYAGFGGTPSVYFLGSWFAHPTATVPDNATGDNYPAMRTMLDLGKELEKIDQGTLLTGSSWHSTCTAYKPD